jgi:hypothetical protein
MQYGISMTPERQARIAAKLKTVKRSRTGQGDAASCIHLDYSASEVEFMFAMQARKTATGRLVMAPADILSVAHQLGYRKTT